MKAGFFLILMTATPALALEPGGQVQGTVDGRAVSAEIWATQSDYSDYGAGASVSIMTRGDLDPDIRLGPVSIGFEGSDFSRPLNTAEITIRIPESNPMQIYGASLDDGLVVTIDTARKEGDLLQITGRVEGNLARRPAMRGATVGVPAETRSITLGFDAVLPPL